MTAVTSLLISWTAWLAMLPRLQHAEACRHVASELLFPAPLHLRLDRHRLERLDAGDAFNQKGLVFGAALKFLLEPAAEHRRRPGRDHDVEREAPSTTQVKSGE